MRRGLVAVLLGALAGAAGAHDTWFALRPSARGGEVALALGTGQRFPVQETGVVAEALRAAGCRDAAGAARPLRPGAVQPQALPLSAALGGADGSCWAQLQPLDITLDAAHVALYLDEIRAPPAVREAWRAQQQRGLPWQERYTKHARIELGAGTPGPVPLALDVVPEHPLPAVGGTLAFTLLHDGRPLPGQAVQALHADTGLGFWLQTDGEGRARLRLPLPGAWLLRGTRLEPDAATPGAWHSQFFTLALQLSGAASPSSSPDRTRRGR